MNRLGEIFSEQGSNGVKSGFALFEETMADLTTVKQRINEMCFSKPQWILACTAVLLLLPLSVAGVTDAPGTRRQDQSKKRIEREKAFLLRSADDLGRSLAYVGETIVVLNEQAEAAASREPEHKAKERWGLLEWYQRYADSLRGMSAEFDLDVNNYFSRHQAGAGWTDRYDELARGFRKFAEELGGIMQKLDGEKKKIEARMQKLNKAVAERRILVDKDDLELARELWPTYRPSDHREAAYKDLSDAEVFYLRNELRGLGEQQQYFENLSELGSYEENWLLIKADEFLKLHEMARAIGGDDPGQVVSAVRGTVRIYEADMAALKRKSSEIDAKVHGIAKTGTLRMLDRLEELSRYYDNMKSRYDRHREWLGVQIGSYQADMVELGKEQ